MSYTLGETHNGMVLAFLLSQYELKGSLSVWLSFVFCFFFQKKEENTCVLAVIQDSIMTTYTNKNMWYVNTYILYLWNKDYINYTYSSCSSVSSFFSPVNV